MHSTIWLYDCFDGLQDIMIDVELLQKEGRSKAINNTPGTRVWRSENWLARR